MRQDTMCGRLDFHLETFTTLKDDYLAHSPTRSLPLDFFWCPLLMIAVIDTIDSKMLTRNYIEPSFIPTCQTGYRHRFLQQCKVPRFTDNTLRSFSN